MKICILIHDLIPYSLKASAKMIYDLALEAAEKGHKVTIFVPASNIKTSYEKIERDGLTIYRFRCGQFENASKFKRTINETMLSYNAWRHLNEVFRKEHHDYIIYYSPTIFWGILVNKLKKLWQVRSYLIVRDFFPQWVIDNGMIKNKSLVAKYFHHFEKLNYAAADTIGIQSPKNLQWFLNNKDVKRKTEVLYNWVKNTPVKISLKKSYRESYNLGNKIVIVYGGNMGPAQDMNNVIELAKALNNFEDFHFILVGNGYEVKLVQDAIKKRVVRNITYLEPISPDEYQVLLAECDIGLFCLNREHKTHNFPGKILGYLTQSLPVLGAVNPGNDLMEIINESGSGFVSLAGEHNELFSNVIKLKSKEVRLSMGKNAKDLMNSMFSVKVAFNKIISHVTED